MKHEFIFHIISAKEISDSTIIKQKDGFCALSNDSLNLLSPMKSSVLGQIQPQLFAHRNMGYEHDLKDDIYKQRWQTLDNVTPACLDSIGGTHNRKQSVNTKRGGIRLEPMHGQALDTARPRNSSLVCQCNRTCHVHSDIPKRSRASSTGGITTRYSNLSRNDETPHSNLSRYDATCDSADPDSDHVAVSFLNRPSHEVLSTDYPHLVVPSSRVCNYSRVTRFKSDLDIKCLDVAYSYLDMCGWYYGPLTMGEARQTLKTSDVGTFLLRDSSDPNYLFSLSVKTRRGTTSIRIVYEKGWFRMDAETSENDHVTSFDCVMKLIENYVTKTSQQDENECILVESTGRMDTPLVVSQGCQKLPGRLKHLCRVSLNKGLTDEQRRRLLIFMPPDIEHFMKGYPFIV